MPLLHNPRLIIRQFLRPPALPNTANQPPGKTIPIIQIMQSVAQTTPGVSALNTIVARHHLYLWLKLPFIINKNL
jgi:hypothetical protein